MNRRQFLGASAASAFAFTYLPSRVWGANERVYVAGIGAGGKGSGDVRDAARAGAQIVALCDVDQQRAAGTYKEFPEAKQYTDFRRMLEKEKGIDAVTVSTPDHTHAVAALMAMNLGKHVYCQKPLTHSVHEARQMAETAQRRGVVTQMGNQAHAGEPIRRAVELVRAGWIGTVKEAHVWTNRPIWPQGMEQHPTGRQEVPAHLDWDLWLGPAAYRPYHPAYLPFKWRGWWDFGTGALGDMACHIMDMPYWALRLGAPDTVEAVSEGATKVSPPVWSTVTYQFPARKELPPVRLMWYDGKKGEQQNLPPKEVIGDVDISKYGAVLVGEKGTLFFNRGNTEWLVVPPGATEGFEMPPKTLPRVQSEDHEWIQAIKGEGHTPLSNFAYAGPFTETVLLGNVAIRAGKKLKWNSKKLRVTNVPEANAYLRNEYRNGWEI